MIIISPLIKRLKELGYEVILNTSIRGKELYENNKYVDRIIYHEPDSVKNEDLHEHWEKLKKEIKPDYYVNLCESIEVNLAIHPRDKERYNLDKHERIKECNRNYYEETFRLANIEPTDYRPHIQFSKTQTKKAKSLLQPNKFNILVALMGSGHNKFYPWLVPIINHFKDNKDFHFITVGDGRARDIEDALEGNVSKMAFEFPMMISLALTKYTDLVIAPDTGVLHAAGCYSTPKIGLLGHTTKENITKHFVNDYSIEAEVFCAPCMRLIYDYTEQCPIDPATGAAMCMGSGIHPQMVIDNINQVYSNWKHGIRKAG